MKNNITEDNINIENTIGSDRTIAITNAASTIQ